MADEIQEITQLEPKPVKMMNLRELSDYLRVHPSTVYRLLKRNQIPAFRIGSNWRFDIETIDEWFAQLENRLRL
jgi:excisionase family DNA binding protein